METAVKQRDDVLQELLGNTQQAIGRIAQAQAPDIGAQIAQLDQKLAEATKVKDERERERRMKVLTSDFETIRKDLETEGQDFAQAVLGLNALMKTMGEEYDNLTKMTPEEQRIITSAENNLRVAQNELALAERKWNIFGIRNRAVVSANAKILEAQQDVENAKEQVKAMSRDRLMHATIETSLQTLMSMVEDTLKIMRERVKAIEIQVQAVGSRKVKAFEIKEQAAKALEVLDGQLVQEEGALQSEEELLTSLINGSPEHSAQTTKISDLRRQVEETRGRRNEALVLFQSKERFAAELEVHEKAQMKLRDNQRAWIRLLTSDTEERVITFKSRLEAMKAMSDQDVAENLNRVGAQADLNNVSYMAQVGAASDRKAIEMLEQQPERMQQIASVQAAQAEAHAGVRDRFARVLEDFKRQYGIDPLDASFFRYGEGQPNQS